MGMPVQVTISSSTTSRAINLDWMSSPPVSYAVTGSSSGTFTYTVEGTLNDLTQNPPAAANWFAISSATTTNSTVGFFQGPLAGIRLNASAVSSASLTLTVLQGIGW